MNVRFASLAVLLAATSLVACEGMRDALTAHTSVAARAENHQLSANRLGELVAASELPVERDVSRALADVWVNYQLLGVAAARGDSLADPAVVDSAMWAAIAGSKARRYFERISVGWERVDSATAPEAYARGDALAADHILLLTQTAPDSVRQAKLRQIRALRARVTPANFAQLAREHSEDQGSAPQGGSLGVFPRGTMVPQFERALLTLEPGGISDIVESEFGYHIIRRPTLGEVREDFLDAMGRMAMHKAESTYTARLDSTARIEVRRNAAAKARAAALDTEAHRRDRSVIASSASGSFTTGRLVQWLETFPPNQQIAQRMASAPDSAIEQLVRNFVRNEAIVRAADSAGITVDSTELNQIRSSFAMEVQRAWMQLRIHPSQLADSATTPAEREQLAVRRIEAHLEAMLANRAPYVPIAAPVAGALRTRYEGRVNTAGVDRAVQIAQRQRAATQAAQPKTESVVPVPPAGGAGPQGQTPPPNAPPATPPGTGGTP